MHLLSILLFLCKKKKSLKWLTILGKHSLYIYVAHVIAFAGVRIVLTNLLGIENLIILLISGILTGLFIPMAIYKLAIKLNMHWLFTLEKVHKPARKENLEPILEKSTSKGSNL